MSAAPGRERRVVGDEEALDVLATELAALHGGGATNASIFPDRLDANPESVERDLGRLVLALVELVRQLLERQASRRIDAGSLTDEQIERMGVTFMRLDRKLKELRASFGVDERDLELTLGSLGALMSEQ
jgi:hypothetical protein